jgi:pimeloyl-ACP methyl ester carboxylesterase
MEFHADSIMQHTNFSFVIPNDFIMEEIWNPRHYDRPTKSLILLHGLTGTDTDWLYGGVAQLMAIQYNVNIFMPTTGNSFYLDKGYPGGNHCEFIAEELPAYIKKTFGIEMKRENSIIGGLSMGGYGALHTALSYPDRFSACIALSSALVVRDVAKAPDSEVGSVLPQRMREELFGDPSKLMDSDMNHEVLYRKLKEQGKDKEALMYIDCDTFAVRDLKPLFEGATQGLAYMQKNEGMPYLTHGPSKRLWDDVKGKTYCGIVIDEHSEMWNSGLIAAPVSVMEKVCGLTLRLCDEMLAQGIKSFNVEQFCFALALRHECQQIHTAEPFFCHYWGNKEGWNQVQTEFFVRSYMEQLTVEQEVQLFKAMDFTVVPYYVKSPIWRDRFLRWTDRIAPLKGQRYLDKEKMKN